MKNLFREEALNSFSSHSEMNKGIRAINIRTLIFAIFLFICAAIFALWLFFGTIYETVTVEGIIWPAQMGGEVYADAEGFISKTTVSEGSEVNAGDILAVIPQTDILEKIESGKAGNITDEQLNSLYNEYDLKSTVRSNMDGFVTYIANENSYIRGGDKIATIVPYDQSGDNKKLTAFIPAENGGLISLGTEAQVMPDFAPREQYGYIKAYISDIASYPVTGQSIKETNSELFLPTLNERESYLRIEITLMPDAQSQSRLKWSNPRSGSVDVAMGTLCGADIVIKECHPYEWLF